MPEDNAELIKIIQYMKAHWPSTVKEEWQVKIEEYPEIAKKIITDLIVDKSRERKFIRIAGLSGSGKTTQLLPAAQAYFSSRNLQPILIGARIFVPYHPYIEEIKEEYGEKNVRKMTDEFATIMLFLVLGKLITMGYDLILDVTLLDPAMEKILVKMLDDAKYSAMMLMIAVSPEITEKFLGQREWRHSKETEQEFIRATKLAMEFYAETCPKMRIVAWNTFDKNPIYDGDFSDVVEVWEKYSGITELPEHNERELAEAKITYLAK